MRKAMRKLDIAYGSNSDAGIIRKFFFFCLISGTALVIGIFTGYTSISLWVPIVCFCLALMLFPLFYMMANSPVLEDEN